MLDLKFEKVWKICILKIKDSEPLEGRHCILFIWIYSLLNKRFSA